MISRLMLSLRKAASAENGWSLMEMSTVRHADEARFAQDGSKNRTRPWLAGNRSRTGFRARRTDEFDQVSVEIFEEIGMAAVKCLDTGI